MPSRRSSDDPMQHEEKLRLESENEASNNIEKKEPVPIKIEYYSPEKIFCDEYIKDGETRENKPEGMAGTDNIDLIMSFYHCRYTRENIQGTYNEMNNYSRNAGALQLYKKDGRTKYTIPGKEGKEYNTISRTVAYGKCTLGHTERILMRKVLDVLIEDECKRLGIPPRPSDYKKAYNDDYQVLENMTEKANEYKKYLESKELIVKMWSERPPCEGKDGIGEDCSTFIQNICPAGSQYGYIVKDYNPNESDKIELVRHAFERLFIAYLIHSQTNVKFQYYLPNTIFSSLNKPEEMAGPSNIHLVTSFYHSRYNEENRIRPHGENFSLNAGAVQLYKADGTTEHHIPGREGKEYNILSSECVCEELMAIVLKDLRNENVGNTQTSENSTDIQITKPSKHFKPDPIMCRQYLEKNNLIVKMWYERLRVWCVKFLIDICPAGSQFGYIVDEHFDPAGYDKQVKYAFDEFRLAFEQNCKSLD
ncbi:uncharacterized protein LOC128986630 [Macrosteles quadrilineatus]|uniref:uncharacterized protein LOC128986630 n=1 Tax=Macrosteles quadrilineatus TaxID=74068 RepID=UPI0023E12301|nr:uncharacterized protein LOC128986630 [Macrosteles quadrilineatus]